MLSEVRPSNLTLVPKTKRKGKPISDRKFAALEFEAWAPISKNNEPVPSQRTMDEIIVSSRLAYLTLLKTKDEVIAMHREDSETAGEMIVDLRNTAERLKELAQMVEGATLRLQVALAAYALA
jgi:hypothetical protein